ncbi:hypothetical protein ACE1BS_23935, partial [Aeromonas jandaei]
AQAEFLALLKPTMNSVDVNNVGVRMDVINIMNEHVDTKYHHEISKGKSPGYRHKVWHMKNHK